MVLYGTQCTGTWYRKSTAYPYTEYREVYIRYLGLKFGDMDRRLRSIPVSDLCGTGTGTGTGKYGSMVPYRYQYRTFVL